MGRKRTRKRASKSTDSGESVSESQAKNQSERSTRSSGSHGPLTGTAAVDQGIGDDINALTGQPEGFNAMAGSNTPDFEPLPTGPDAQIQRALEGTDTTRGEVPGTVLDVLGQGGNPLDQPIQRALEERMDADFSNVRIHTGAKAAEAADAIDAKAFTCGNDIVFNSGEYDPKSAEGQFLLAHELAHVRQQTGAAISMMPKSDGNLDIDPDPQLEREADEAAQQALAGDEPLIVNRMGTDIHIQRTGAGAPIPGAGGPLVEQLRELEEDTEDDEGITLRKLLKGAAKAGISTGIITTLVQTSALETGLTDPETAMITGAASVTAATGLTAKRLAYQKLDPQVWRRIFAAAGHEDLLASILRNLGHEPDWAEDLGETEPRDIQ